MSTSAVCGLGGAARHAGIHVDAATEETVEPTAVSKAIARERGFPLVPATTRWPGPR